MNARPEDLTRRLLADAGLSEGMRVLDIGCGRGDVTFIAAELVGARGQVLGIDREEAPLAVARERARELGLANVSFARVDLADLDERRGLFDAVACRRVLMYQQDAVATLRKVAGVLAPGGLIALQEHDSTGLPICLSAMPLHSQVHRWIWQTVAREGGDVQMGLHLAPALAQAGFTVECIRAEAVVLTPTQSHPIETIVGAMIGRMTSTGVATEAEIDIDTLGERLAAERRNANGTCIWEMVYGAWARRP